MLSEITPLLSQAMSNPLVLTLLAALGSWFAGAGITRLLALPFAQRILGAGLLTAKAPALALGKAANVPPFRFFIGPIVCLLIFLGFWLFTFMDTLLGCLSPDVRKLADSLEEMLGKLGSTDRKLYIMAKSMTAPQVKAVEAMAQAVKTGPEEMTVEQEEILLKAQAIGRAMQDSRLAADK